MELAWASPGESHPSEGTVPKWFINTCYGKVREEEKVKEKEKEKGEGKGEGNGRMYWSYLVYE